MTEPKYFTIKVLLDNIEPGKLQQILDYYNNNKDVNEAPLQILDRAEGGFKIDIPPEKWVIDDYFRFPNPIFIDENNKIRQLRWKKKRLESCGYIGFTLKQNKLLYDAFVHVLPNHVVMDFE
jgi:hypothetical protein